MPFAYLLFQLTASMLPLARLLFMSPYPAPATPSRPSQPPLNNAFPAIAQLPAAHLLRSPTWVIEAVSGACLAEAHTNRPDLLSWAGHASVAAERPIVQQANDLQTSWGYALFIGQPHELAGQAPTGAAGLAASPPADTALPRASATLGY